MLEAFSPLTGQRIPYEAESIEVCPSRCTYLVLRIAPICYPNGGDSIIFFEASQNVFERFQLMGERFLAFRREGRAMKPTGNCLQVILRQSFEIISANAEKPLRSSMTGDRSSQFVKSTRSPTSSVRPMNVDNSVQSSAGRPVRNFD